MKQLNIMLIGIIILILTLNSCGSIIGLSTGLIVDASSDDFDNIELEKLKKINKRKVLYIDTTDSLISGRYDSANYIPDSIINFYYKHSVLSIPINKICNIEIKRSKNAKWYGLVLGMAADIIFWVYAIKNEIFKGFPMGA